MTNKHSFNSTIIEKHYFNSTIKSRSNFNSTIIYKKSYNSIIDGFTQSTTSSAKFFGKTTIVVGSANYTINASANFINGDTRLYSGSAVNLYVSSGATFRQGGIIYAQPDVSLIAGTAIFTQEQSIYALLNTQINLSAIMSIPFVNISASPTAHKYYLVSDWDGSSLSAIDTMNLTQLDYINL